MIVEQFKLNCISGSATLIYFVGLSICAHSIQYNCWYWSDAGHGISFWMVRVLSSHPWYPRFLLWWLLVLCIACGYYLLLSLWTSRLALQMRPHSPTEMDWMGCESHLWGFGRSIHNRSACTGQGPSSSSAGICKAEEWETHSTLTFEETDLISCPSRKLFPSLQFPDKLPVSWTNKNPSRDEDFRFTTQLSLEATLQWELLENSSRRLHTPSPLLADICKSIHMWHRMSTMGV